MSKVKLQIPMDKKLRDSLEKRAAILGFDSAQAYIRVWATAEIEGRHLDFGEDTWGKPSAKAITRWEKQIQEIETEKKAGKLKSYSSAKDLMKDLRA